MAAEEERGLTLRMIENSKGVHKKSNALLMAKVATLFTDRQLYGQAIGCFYLVFVDLEEALRAAMKADKRVGSMAEVMEPLWRVPAYEQDLRFHLGPDWRQQIPTSPAIQAYSARLRRLAAEQPLLLLAHAFTQHLAGLSGGRIIKRLARKYMKLPDDKGTAIFEFPGGTELKDAFKAAMDDAGRQLSEEEVQQVLDEQLLAFRLNIEIMQEFKVGLLPQLRAPLRLLPALPLRYWAAGGAVLAAAAAAMVGTSYYVRS